MYLDTSPHRVLNVTCTNAREGMQTKYNTIHLRELRQNIKILKRHSYEALYQRIMKIEIISGAVKFSVWYEHNKNKFSISIYTG